MNELDLIRSFRAELPGPSAAATATAERAWRRGRPLRGRWSRWAGGRSPLAPGGERRGTRTLAGRRRQARALVGGAAVVVALSAAALILPSEQDSRLGTQPASAAQTLRHAAAAQVGGLTRPLRPGEYWYARRKTAWPTFTGKYVLIQPQIREDWVGGDGSRRWVVRQDGEPRFPGPRHRERWEAAGLPDLMPASEQHAAPEPRSFFDGAKHVTYAQLLALPRDPEALYRRMHQAAVDCECGSGVDQETFVIAGDLLRDNPIPLDLRAAILRAAALIPGIKLLDHVRDVAGRPGVGVAFDGVGPRSVLIFDAKTYELLGENDGRGGSADLESTVVGSINERP